MGGYAGAGAKIAEAELVVPGSGEDSDIQNDFIPLTAAGPAQGH
jgi:hypothetical protein